MNLVNRGGVSLLYKSVVVSLTVTLGQGVIAAEKTEILTPQGVMSLYQAGVSQVFKAAPGMFREQRELWVKLIWAELKEDDTIVAISSGKLSPQAGLITILNPKGVEMQTAGPTLRIGGLLNYNAVLVRPYRVTSAWAGPIMIRELTRFEDANKSPRASLGQMEWRSTSAEKLAVNALSGGKLIRALNEVLQLLKVSQAEDLLAMAKDGRPLLQKVIMTKIDSVIGLSGHPDLREMEMRLDFYLRSLMIQLQENQKVAVTIKNCQDLELLLNSVGKY